MNDEKNVAVAPKEVRKEIEELLHTRFEVPEDFALEDEYGNDTFFGLYSLLGPRELNYLAYMLERRYDIQFGMDEYDDPQFYSLGGLSQIVAKMVEGNIRQEVR